MSNEVTNAELQGFKKEKVIRYTNGEITVYWRPEKCVHSANCIIGNPRVFNTQKSPWITLSEANSDEVIETINTCPSRALLYRKNQSTPALEKVAEVPASEGAKIRILRNGPALISGNFVIRDANNQQIEIKTEIAAICRCGASKKKPFCDGNHTKIGFKD